jgi:hypothetical protein
MKSIYAEKALAQIPRLLSLQDRNEFSPTYGCFNREYWLCKTVDFPSAIAQFGVHSLALVYTHAMPGNIYYQQPKILAWTLAGMNYWMKIQKRDGSFDEFYPHEHGWAGPTGFLLYAMLDSYRLLGSAFPQEWLPRFREVVHKAALFLGRYDEAGVLANHHAMALLPLYEAVLFLNDATLRHWFEVRLEDFLSYCYEEGWCLEYDGADPGYLSATVSFLAKLRKIYQDERLDRVIQRAIEFSSYFVYPNRFYGGSLGSRQTLHFYPHGYELLRREIPLAGVIADEMRLGLQEGKLVPPEIQEDRYFLYRIPEFLQAYIDAPENEDTPSNDSAGQVDPVRPKLPHQGAPFLRYFSGARILATKSHSGYLLVNLAKGGMIKCFNQKNELIFNDCGLIGRLADGRVVTSAWIDPGYEIQAKQQEFAVQGDCHYLGHQVFNPFTMILFRLFMLTLGWSTRLSYSIKGLIRNILTLTQKKSPIRFHRQIILDKEDFFVSDTITIADQSEFTRLNIGDELMLRFVPQSRYFQSQELALTSYTLTSNQLDELNHNKTFTLRRQISGEDGRVTFL